MQVHTQMHTCTAHTHTHTYTHAHTHTQDSGLSIDVENIGTVATVNGGSVQRKVWDKQRKKKRGKTVPAKKKQVSAKKRKKLEGKEVPQSCDE